MKLKFQNLFASLLDKVTLGVAKALGVFVDQDKLLKYKPIPLCYFYRDLHRPVPKYFIGHAAYTIDQKAYRFRNDDGSETTATWKAAENTRWEVTDFTTADINFRLRMMVQEIGGSSGITDATIQYQRNNGTWTDITTTSSYVRIRLSSNFADGAATTSQLTSGTGSFIAGQMRETVTAATINHAGSDYGENEWSLFFRSADCLNGDNYKFRMLRSGTAFSTNSQYPEVFSWTPVSTIEDLNNIRNSLSGSTIVGNFRLTKDLDFQDPASYSDPANMGTYNNGAGWVALGSTGNPWFGASIDGNGYDIKNLMCNDTATGVSNAGFIGVMDALNSSSTIVIENLGLINPRINANATNTAFNQCGALIMGIDPAGTNIIRKCFVRGGVVVGGTGAGNNGTGGMIGIAHRYSTGGVQISDCYVEGTEIYRNGTAPASTNGVGGLVGGFTQISGSAPFTVIDCYASASSIKGDSTATRGGLIGYDATTATYTTSYYNSTTTNYAGAGGIAKTDANMKIYSEFSSVFSIANTYAARTTETWYMQSGDYPRLYYENYSPSVSVSMVSGTPTVATYYFDASDVAVTDPNGHWATDTNAFDGSISTYATNNGGLGEGSSATGYFEATGTTAPISGGFINKVRARIYANNAITGNETAHFQIYTDLKLIGYVTNNTDGPSWSQYVTLVTPDGGWTWQKINNLRSKVWMTRTASSGYTGVSRMDLEVTSETTPTTTSTPALVMNGVDTETNDIRYQVEVDTSPRFIGTSATLIQEFTTTTNGYAIRGGANTRIGQSFSAPSTTSIKRVRFNMYRFGAPRGQIRAALWTHTGTFGTSSTGASPLIARSLSMNIEDITVGSGNNAWYDFYFDTPVNITSGVRYVIVLEVHGLLFDGASDYVVMLGSSTGGHAGNYVAFNGTTWGSSSGIDIAFGLYSGADYLRKLSGTDSGFSGTPDTTDPFASAQNVTHTIQSALGSGTYYWRARGIDPSGRNIYGGWSDPSSFAVSAIPSFTKPYTTDALKRKASLSIHTTSANRKKTNTRSHTTNSNKQTVGNYHYEGKTILPTTADILSGHYNATNYSEVATNDNVYKDFAASGYIVEQFWKYNANNTDEINMTIAMKSSLAPSTSPVYLQLYEWGGVNTYYFDGSDAAATDPGAVWTNETNADDGSTATVATTITDGSKSSNYLQIEGTDAPASGGSITQVRSRMHDLDGWSSYQTLSAPVGGWTWAEAQALEVRAWKTDPIVAQWNYEIYEDGDAGGTALVSDVSPETGAVEIARIEIEVTSGGWTTIASNSVTAADTEFTLTGSQTTNLANYYTTGNKVAVRIYQQVV